MSEVERAYRGSNADATRALFLRLIDSGPIGDVAINLFRASKASGRAKEYRGRYVRAAYDKKDWSLEQLCIALDVHADDIGIRWGWARDEKAVNFENVLYCDLPGGFGQVSFHCARRIKGPDYPWAWDGAKGEGPDRIIKFATAVLQGDPLNTGEAYAVHTGTETAAIDGSQGEQSQPGEEQKSFGF